MMKTLTQVSPLENLMESQRLVGRKGLKRPKIKAPLNNIDKSDDILYEVMKHMDAESLATAACVSKKWKRTAEDESLWENVCIQHWPSSPVSRHGQLRTVVLALGGFRRLYVQCLRPIVYRGRAPQPVPSSLVSQDNNGEREWSRDEVDLSLSLFSIDCYERLSRRHLTPSSLKLLSRPSARLALGPRSLYYRNPTQTSPDICQADLSCNLAVGS